MLAFDTQQRPEEAPADFTECSESRQPQPTLPSKMIDPEKS
jgi:hypothetical protein